MKYFSTFSGVGGFEIGIQNAYANNRINKEQETGTQSLSSRGSSPVSPIGLGDGGDESAECIGFSEIDKYASAVLRYHFPNTKNYGDITKINWADVPDFDLLVGGSPCQDLSVAGKGAGLDGTRSGLFREYIRALKEKRPSFFIWENVKGALSSGQGWDFESILNQMAEAGYSLWWQVLNAKDFGVPQNRERVFVIGSRNRPAREVFFERQDGGVHHGEKPSQSSYLESPLRSQGDKPMIEITRGVSDAQRIYDPAGIGKTLKGLGGGQGAKTGLYNVQDRIRRLMPIECERLMSWPETEISATVEICLDHQKKPVSAVIQNPKSQRPASLVALRQQSESALSVGGVSLESPALSGAVADFRVEINVETRFVSLNKLPKELSPSVSIVENIDWSDQAEKLALSVLRSVVSQDTEVREIEHGKEALPRYTTPFIQVQNGKALVRESGEETLGLVKDVTKGQASAEDTSTTSQAGQGSQNSDLLKQILSSSAVRAIVGFIQKTTATSNSFTVEFVVKHGWTRYGDFDGEVKGISDSQRYKMCGNGVVSKVVEEVLKAHIL